MYLKRGENPFKSSKRTESDRRERDFDKAYGGTFYFLLRSKTWVGNLLNCISLQHFFVSRSPNPEEKPSAVCVVVSTPGLKLSEKSFSCILVPER